MFVRTPPSPGSVGYSWLASVASCDAHTFFNNSVGFCSFGKKSSGSVACPTYQQLLQSHPSNLNQTNITIVSNQILNIETNKKKAKNQILPLHAEDHADQCLPQ